MNFKEKAHEIAFQRGTSCAVLASMIEHALAEAFVEGCKAGVEDFTKGLHREAASKRGDK